MASAMVLLFLVSGCAPTFTDDECATDADCFADEQCLNGQCVIGSSNNENNMTTGVSVDAFTASPESVMVGEEVTLSWELSGAESAEIVADEGDFSYDIPEADLESGSTTVTVEVDTTFTLTAQQGIKKDVAAASVTVEMYEGPPVIDSFEVDATQVATGQVVTFTWQAQGATAGEFIVGEDATELTEEELAQGSREVTIDEAVDVTLRVTNDDGDAEETLSITIIPPPTVDTFTATPETINTGDTVTLAWTTTGADSIEIVDDLGNDVDVSGADIADGSVTVTPAASTVYTLTATNVEGTDRKSAGVTVEIPLIIDLAATTDMLTEGESTTLSWSASGAESIAIEDDDGNMLDLMGQPVESGSVMVSPTETTTYLATVSNADGDTATDMVTIQVTPLPPTITTFTASPNPAVQGEATTLSWETSGADAIEIVDDQGNMVDLTGKSTDMDSVDVTIDRPSVTFTLTATNGGGMVTRDYTVTSGDGVSIASFSVDKNSILVGESITLSWEVINSTGLTLVSDVDGPIDISALGTTDQITLSPTQTTNYTLSAQGIGGPINQGVAVIVETPVSIDSFTVTPTTLEVGNSVTIDWQTTAATSLTLQAVKPGAPRDVSLFGKNVAGDSVTDTPEDEVTAYKLIADGPGGPVEQQIPVLVYEPAAVVSFTADVNEVGPNGVVNFSWQTSGATAISLEDDQGNTIDLTGKNLLADSVAVTVSQTATYTFTVDGENMTSDTAQQAITVVQPPTINSFTSSPMNPVLPGATVTLSWDVTGADTIDVTDSGGASVYSGADAVGSAMITANADETYTLTASNVGGDATQDVTVTLQTSMVSVDSFMADVAAVPSGGAVTLSWATTDADTVQITDDQGGAPYDVPMADLAAGSLVVRPQVSTTYTITATDMFGSDTAQVSVTVDAAALLITEVLYDVDGGGMGVDDNLEWIELHNAGDTFVDLSNYSLGAGSMDYTETTVQLTGTLAPGECAVIGGATSSMANGLPTFKQALDLDPDLPQGGADGAGVALFFAEAMALTAATTPIDSVVYGAANNNGLLDEAGAVDAEVSPEAPEGSSLERVGDSDVFRVQAEPSPGNCVHLVAITPDSNPDEATGEVTITGYGFDAALDRALLRDSTPADFDMSNCAEVTGGLSCDLSSVAASADATFDVVVSREGEYVPDANGDPMVMALGAPVESALAGAYSTVGRLVDGVDITDTDFYCGIETVGPIVTTAGMVIDADMILYLFGETPTGGAVPGTRVVEAALIARGALPYELSGVSWQSAAWSSDSGNNDVHTASFMSATAQQAEVAFRVSLDGGQSFYYCDTNASAGSNDGYNANGGLAVEWQ